MHASTPAASPDQHTLAVADAFVRLMANQDLSGVVALYAPDAVWEIHVPGWDDRLTDHRDLLAQHREFFGRDEFRIDRHELIANGEQVALTWDLGWRDRRSGLPAASFQSHTFLMHDGLIRLHRMYCAGVRVYEPAAGAGEEG